MRGCGTRPGGRQGGHRSAVISMIRHGSLLAITTTEGRLAKRREGVDYGPLKAEENQIARCTEVSVSSPPEIRAHATNLADSRCLEIRGSLFSRLGRGFKSKHSFMARQSLLATSSGHLPAFKLGRDESESSYSLVPSRQRNRETTRFESVRHVNATSTVETGPFIALSDPGHREPASA